MPTLTLRPNGNGTYNAGFSANGNGTIWECVDEAVPDEDGTYASCITSESWKYFTVTLQNHGAEVGTINSVKVYIRQKKQTGTDVKFSGILRLSGSNSYGTTTALYSDYQTANQTLARPGGGGWSWADIDNLECGVRVKAEEVSSGAYYRCTQIYIVVDYTVYTPPAVTPVAAVAAKMIAGKLI